jgi:hypothetical protein
LRSFFRGLDATAQAADTSEIWAEKDGNLAGLVKFFTKSLHRLPVFLISPRFDQKTRDIRPTLKLARLQFSA